MCFTNTVYDLNFSYIQFEVVCDVDYSNSPVLISDLVPGSTCTFTACFARSDTMFEDIGQATCTIGDYGVNVQFQEEIFKLYTATWPLSGLH